MSSAARAWLGLLFAGLLLASPAAAQSAEDWSPQTFTLSNGMRAVVLPDHRAPVVTHMVWYRVGSADEAPGKSGIAHFLEHLMFKATKTRPAGEYSRTIARNGGQDNAGTSFDFTNYHFRIAKEELDGRVVSTIGQLDLRDREEELAAMLDGLPLTPGALETARTMLERASRPG